MFPSANLLLLAAAGCLLYLGWSDVHTRLLPNRWVLLYTLLFFPAQALLAPGWAIFGGHLLIGIIAFVVLALLFALNAMGGGDVKLGAAVFMWAGPQGALTALIITAWLGGLLGIIGWLPDRAVLRRLTNLKV